LGQCSPQFNFPNDLLAVGLAVIDIMLRLAGFLAVISIIIAGFNHLFTGGSPEKAAAARSRLINSIIGLIIALTATAIVTFLGRQLT
jgi:type IV secretory pathway VirB2 component (pilin)